jgi:hypothetical protein
MGGIDRTVIGSERWRWHPINPIHMKRHGDTSETLHSFGRSGREVLGKPIMELVNARFRRKFALFSAKSGRN